MQSDTGLKTITYAVLGNGTKQFPYLEGIRSFARAVEIARHYPQVFSDGASTHVLEVTTDPTEQSDAQKEGREPEFRYSRRWQVFKNGTSKRMDVHFKRKTLFDTLAPTDDTQRSPCLDEGTHRQLVALIHAAEDLGATSSVLQLEETLTEGAVSAQDMA